ncbi:hypothetical protein [Massilia sp. PWRC2]|uniref:hypothetical protein n=1 Tax=Massilia sp. PWRC2 TaxID=2804626 RepID=UPI003CE972A3
MESLKRRSTSRSGLASGVHVKDCIYAIAKDNRLKLAATGFSIALENPRGALKDFKKSAFDDLDCLTKTIDRLETDLDGMRLRANA